LIQGNLNKYNESISTQIQSQKIKLEHKQARTRQESKS